MTNTVRMVHAMSMGSVCARLDGEKMTIRNVQVELSYISRITLCRQQFETQNVLLFGSEIIV